MKYKLHTKNFLIKLLIILNIILIGMLSISSVTMAENVTSDTENKSSELNIYAKSCILVECSTGRTAYEKNSDEKLYPASTTKILTAILAVENCKMDDVVTITSEMTSKVPASYTTAYLRPGEKITVEELLNVLLIPSANDAGFALAIHISGSVEEFANLMNTKAEELGCTNTHFTNPSGIHNNEHYSTAKDMSLIAMKAMSYPQIVDIVCKTSYKLKPESAIVRNFETTNTLLKPDEPNYYEYATGMKTGFTTPAGACIIATAKKDDMQFLAVVLGAPEPTTNMIYRDADCKTLFEYGFENYEIITKIDKPVISFLNDTLPIKTSVNDLLKYVIAIFGIAILLMIIKTVFKGKKSKKK